MADSQTDKERQKESTIGTGAKRAIKEQRDERKRER